MGIKKNTENIWGVLNADNIIAPEKTQIGLSGPSSFIQKNHADLRNDPRYQAEAEKFLSYLSEQEGMAEKLTGGAISNDIFETLRDEEGRLLTVIDRARVLREAPEEIKQTYRYLRDNFEASKAGSFGEMLKATFDRGVDMFADPINLAFALVAPGLGSAVARTSTGAATRVLTSQAGKQNVKKTLNNIAAANADSLSPTVTGVSAAFEGGIWTGVENANRQDINITTGLQDAFSDGDFALSVGLGIGLGGSLGYGASKLFSRRTTNVAETGQSTTPTVLPPPNSSINSSASSTAEQEAETLVSGLFNKVELKTDRRGKQYYDRQGNPEVNLTLLKNLKKELGNQYDDVRIANIILAIKDTIFKKLTPDEVKQGLNFATKQRTLQINDIDPEVLKLFEQYGLKNSEIQTAITFVKNTYMKDAEKTATKVLKGQKVKVTQTIDLDDAQIGSLADQLAAKTGGGQRTSEILTDAIQEANATRGITNIARESSILRKVLDKTSDFNARYLTGKVTGIFNKYQGLSPNVINSFQERIVSAVSNSWKRGESIVRDTNDYGNVFNIEFGRLGMAWKAIYDPIAETTLKGGYKEEIDTLLSNAIRTNDIKTLARETQHLGKDVRKSLFNIVKFGRSQLKEMGDESQGKGLVNNLIDNYLPRLWKRSEIENNKEDFISLLEKNVNWKQHVDLEETIDANGNIIRRQLTNKEKAEKVWEELLDIKFQFGNDSGTGMNSFFARRQLELKDETAFTKYLDNDLNNVMLSYHRSTAKAIAKDTVFGVRNIEDFNTTWFPALEKEMRANGATTELINQAKKDMTDVYQNVTGEGLDRYKGWKGTAADSYMLFNRMALLPLSTLSSLSEIFINISKAGVKTSFAGYRDAIFSGSKKMFDDSLNGLQKSFNMTSKEAMHELNQMGTALDQAFADYADRLGGDALSSPRMRNVSNKFFRFTLLDQWTKGVQTASYIIGKRLIAENLESIASHMPLIQTGKISRRVQRQIDELADLGINYNEGVSWLNKGANIEDDFYRKLKEGANTYTNEVILNPSAQSGIKPMYMSNPKTAILGQLLGYPAAFTNTVMKNMARQIARNPETALTQHIPAVGIMTAVAMFTNAARTQGESLEGKPHEVIGGALARAGFNGLPADMFTRGRTAAEIYQSPTAYMTGFGPLWGDAYKLGVSADVFSILGQKIPGYGAFNAIFGATEATEDWPDKYREMLRAGDTFFQKSTTPEQDVVSRKNWEKGGEVYNVPQVTEEPDERIDRMTGLPYDVQAGGAFIDEEDRQGFALGTIVSKAAPVLKSKLSEALGELADKGENIPINRLVKRLQNRGVRKDEIEAAGIDEDGNAWHSPTQESEEAAAQIRTVVTRSGNLAYTPDGLRAIDKARMDKPLIDSNFVTAKETLLEHNTALEKLEFDAELAERGIPYDGKQLEADLIINEEGAFFDEYTPLDVNDLTLETRIFRDPRGKQIGAESKHFVLNLPKGSAAIKAGYKDDPYSYHVRFDEIDPALRVFEMQSDLAIGRKTRLALYDIVFEPTKWKKKSNDNVYNVLLDSFNVNKKDIKFSKEQGKQLGIDVKNLNALYKEAASMRKNIKEFALEDEKLYHLDTLFVQYDLNLESFVKESDLIADLKSYIEKTKYLPQRGINKDIKNYISKFESQNILKNKITDKVQDTLNAINISKVIPEIDVSQNIINRMIAETKERGLPEISFLIGRDTPESRKYMGVPAYKEWKVKPNRSKGHMQRSYHIQEYYEDTVAPQVQKIAKKIGATTRWDDKGYLTIVLPEKEFTLPIYKNEGGYISRQKYMAGTLARTGANIIKGLWHGSPHSVPTLKASKSIDSNALQLGRGVAATKDKKIAESYLDATPNRSVGLSEKALLEERTARGSSTPTLYELEAHINEDEIIRTGTKFADQPTPVQTRIDAIAKDYDIQLSDKDKDSKRIFYILKRNLEDKDLKAEDIFKNYGIKAAKRDLRETSLEGLSLGGNEEYSFYDDSVLEIVSKNIKTGGPENLIQGGTALIKKAKEAGMDTERIVYHAAGERWATDGITFDEKYFLDNYMDDISPENHMVYLGTDADISSFYAQKKWNSKAEAADRAAGRKIKKDYWTTPEILPMFLKGPGLKLKIDKWAPSTYKSPDNKAMPWGKWFIQDAMDQLNIKTPVTKKSDMIKEIWKEAKKQGYGYIEFINVEDVSKAADITPQTQIIPLGPDKVKSIYANYNPDATKEDLMRNLFSATGGSIRKQYKDGGILKGGLGNRIVRSLRFLLNTKDAINYYKEGYRQEAIEAGARAVGIGAREQRLNERDAAKAINDAVAEGILKEAHAVPVDDYGFTKGNVDELFNAVNHGLLSFRYGTNPAMRGLLQLKEGEKFGQAAENPIDSSVDSFNNSRGFYLEQQGLTESAALQEMIRSKQRTDLKLNLGLPLVRGQDFIFNSEDLKAVGTQETLGPLYTGRIERNKGGKLLGSLHRSNCK